MISLEPGKPARALPKTLNLMNYRQSGKLFLQRFACYNILYADRRVLHPAEVDTAE